MEQDILQITEEKRFFVAQDDTYRYTRMADTASAIV